MSTTMKRTTNPTAPHNMRKAVARTFPARRDLKLERARKQQIEEAAKTRAATINESNAQAETLIEQAQRHTDEFARLAAEAGDVVGQTDATGNNERQTE